MYRFFITLFFLLYFWPPSPIEFKIKPNFVVEASELPSKTSPNPAPSERWKPYATLPFCCSAVIDETFRIFRSSSHPPTFYSQNIGKPPFVNRLNSNISSTSSASTSWRRVHQSGSSSRKRISYLGGKQTRSMKYTFAQGFQVSVSQRTSRTLEQTTGNIGLMYRRFELPNALYKKLTLVPIVQDIILEVTMQVLIFFT